MKRKRYISSVALWLLAMVAFAVALAPYFSRLHWSIDLFTHFQFQAFVFSILAMILGGWRGQFSLVFALGTTVLLTGHNIFWQPGVENAPKGTEASVTITSLNVLHTNNSYAKTLDYLRTTKSDVICIVEADHEWCQKLQAGLPTHQHRIVMPRTGAGGMILLSRYPIARKATEEVKGTTLPLIDAGITTPSGEMRVIVAHPIPPMNKELAHQNATYFERIEERVGWAPDFPVVIAGDLNATPWSKNYRQLTLQTRLKSAIPARPWQATWSPIKHPLLGLSGLTIDQIMATPDFRLVSRTVGPSNGSDHRPITVAMTLGDLPEIDPKSLVIRERVGANGLPEKVRFPTQNEIVDTFFE